MAYVKLTESPGSVYRYTRREDLDSILEDGMIKRFADAESWFYLSLEDTLGMMRSTVMSEGNPYYSKSRPEDYVVLKLSPQPQDGEWVRWMPELPPGASASMRADAFAFSMLKAGFRGDLKFDDNVKIFEAALLLHESPPSLHSRMTPKEAACFQYGESAVRNGMPCVPLNDSRMKREVSESHASRACTRNTRLMSAWTLGYLRQYLADGKLLNAELFHAGAAALCPTVDESAAEIWASFARDRVDAEQYVNFIPEPDAVAVSRWYDTLLAGFARTGRLYGSDAAEKVYHLGLEGLCLYTYEMSYAAEEIEKGADCKRLCELIEEGMLDSSDCIFPKLADELAPSNTELCMGQSMTLLS